MAWSTTSRQSRGYGAAWEKTRTRVLARDSYLCQRCLRANRVQAGNECHHIKPKAQGGNDDDTNLETLCHTCHEDADAEASGRTHREKIKFTADGWPIWSATPLGGRSDSNLVAAKGPTTNLSVKKIEKLGKS